MTRLPFARRLARGNRGTLPALPAAPPPVPVDGPVGLRFEAPELDGACLHPRLREARDCPTCGPHVAHELRPRLVVRKGSGGWSWWVVTVDGRPIASNFDRGFHAWHRTHPEALAVGLAALDAAHAAPPCT